MKLDEICKKENIIFEGRIITLKSDDVILPDGKEANREYVTHKGGVCVVPLDKDENVVFVRQFRYPYGKVLLEIPAGKRESLTEDPLSCGMRELKEETGATCEKLVSLGEFYPTPGYTNEVIYMFLAKDLEFGEANPDEDEFLLVERIPLWKAVDMVMNGEIKDGKTQAAILKTYYLLKK